MIAEFLEIEKSWFAAHKNLELDVIEDILSDQYRQIHSDGTVTGKDELLTSYRSGDRRWDVAESDEYEISILGDVALLIGHWRGVGTNEGLAFDYAVRFLTVYQLENSEWKLIADVSVPLDELNHKLTPPS